MITQVDSRLGLADDNGGATSPIENVVPLSEYVQTPTDDVEEYERSVTEWEKEKARYDGYIPYITAVIVGGAVLFVIGAYRYRKLYVKENTINGIYIGVGSAYYASTHPGAGSDYDGGGGGFGGFGGGGGGGFSGGGASGSW